MNSLPNELMLLIAQHIDIPNGRIPLLRVCRKWRSLFFESAYSRIFLNGDWVAEFTNTLQLHPEIAQRVKILTMQYWEVSEHEQYDNRFDSSPLRKVLEEMAHSEEEFQDWDRALQNRVEDAWFAILLSRLGNLEELSMDFPFRTEYFSRVMCRGATREKPFDNKPILQHLKRVFIEEPDVKDGIAIEFVPFFHLPSMQTFCAEGISENTGIRHPAQESAKGTSPITTIQLRASNGRHGMSRFITSCANLDTFIYQHTDRELWREGDLSFRPRFFYRALCSQKHSLRVLHMNEYFDYRMDYVDADDEPDHHPDDWFGSLAEFTKLEELHIRVANLLNFNPGPDEHKESLINILPPSIRFLHLTGYEDGHRLDLEVNLKEVLQYRQNRFPNLAAIEVSLDRAEYTSQLAPGVLGGDYMIPTLVVKAFGQIQNICNDAGVNFTLSLGDKECTGNDFFGIQ